MMWAAVGSVVMVICCRRVPLEAKSAPPPDHVTLDAVHPDKSLSNVPLVIDASVSPAAICPWLR